jgi:predicted permease
MRMAIGAARVRIFRQVLIESLLLAVAAGALGLAVARLGMRLLSTFSLPGDIAIADAGLAIDARVFAFAAALAGVTAIAFGLAPAIWASRPALMDAVRGMSTGGAGGRWRGGAPLIAVQAAISIVLVVGALLFVRSLQGGLTRDLGFRTNGVVAVTMHLQQSGYNNERGRAALGEVMRILQDRPTIHSAAIAAFVPPGAVGLRLPVAAQETKRAAAGGRLFVNPVSANYFDVLGIPLARGRSFTDADEIMDAEAVAIVTEETARQLWPDEDAIGRRLNLFPGLVEDSWRVVGVVRDGEFGTQGVITPSVFLPFAHFAGSVEVSLLAHGAGPTAATLGIVRDAIRQVDNDLPVFNARALDAQLAEVLMPQRFGTALLGMFGVMAVLISAVGMYATVAYDVARRRRELAIRAALGAGRRELITAVLSRAAAAVIAGIVVGLGAAALLTGGLRAFLFGVTPHEPVSYGLAPIILGITAAVATCLPLRHAQRTDPMQTLRE